MQNSVASAERVFSLIDAEPEIVDTEFLSDSESFSDLDLIDLAEDEPNEAEESNTIVVTC